MNIDAVTEGKDNYRSADDQLNFGIEIGKNALANPDLPVEFIRDVLIAKRQKPEPFEFVEKEGCSVTHGFYRELLKESGT